jgi:hypothetical protein
MLIYPPLVQASKITDGSIGEADQPVLMTSRFKPGKNISINLEELFQGIGMILQLGLPFSQDALTTTLNTLEPFAIDLFFIIRYPQSSVE